MLSFKDIQDLVASNFFEGNGDLAGIVMFMAVIGLILAITRGNAFMALIIGMIATLFFSAVGIISTEVTVLLIIVSVLGMAYTSRGIWADR